MQLGAAGATPALSPAGPQPAAAGQVAQPPLNPQGLPVDATSHVPAAVSGSRPAPNPAAPNSATVSSTPSQAAPMGEALTATGDPWASGPFKIARLDMAGPKHDATVVYPTELGKGGVKQPFAVWGNDAGAQGPDYYRNINDLVPSHGIVVYITHRSTETGSELIEGIDWMIAESSRAGSLFEGKLDTTHIASMGHSMGSLATFAIAGDSRLTTTVHLSGGSGSGRARNLHVPALFVCGVNTGATSAFDLRGDLAAPRCEGDFMNATVPVAFCSIPGGTHASAFLQMHGAVVGWLRWQLIGDMSMKNMFVGSDCELCTRKNWSCKSKGLLQ
jgi:hypothetical protein